MDINILTPTFQSEILEQVPGYIGWKDKNFRYLGCNRNLATVLKLENPNKIKGLTDLDLADCTEDTFKFHRKNDQLALKGAIIKMIHKSTFPYDGSLFYFVKKPLLDNENNIVGVIYHCQEFINPGFISQHYQIENGSDPFQLSPRELECLFCILRGASAKQTAEIMKISRRTVETYLENIKNKFSCDSKSELLSLAIQAGYMNIIPPRFLQSDFSFK